MHCKNKPNVHLKIDEIRQITKINKTKTILKILYFTIFLDWIQNRIYSYVSGNNPKYDLSIKVRT